MHVESTHTNPVAMVFVSILQAESLTALKRKENKILNIVPRGEFFFLYRDSCLVFMLLLIVHVSNMHRLTVLRFS